MEHAKRRSDADEFWYDRKMDESLNRWFASYDDAVRSLHEVGGYLLPFRHQFVIVEEAAIKALGLDPADPDWKAIGHNLIAPDDDAAFQRIKARRNTIRKQQT